MLGRPLGVGLEKVFSGPRSSSTLPSLRQKVQSLMACEFDELIFLGACGVQVGVGSLPGTPRQRKTRPSKGLKEAERRQRKAEKKALSDSPKGPAGQHACGPVPKLHCKVAAASGARRTQTPQEQAPKRESTKGRPRPTAPSVSAAVRLCDVSEPPSPGCS